MKKNPAGRQDDWPNLDLNDKVAVDRFIEKAALAGKQAGAEVVARLVAAGIPVASADDQGNVTLDLARERSAPRTNASKTRKPSKRARA